MASRAHLRRPFERALPGSPARKRHASKRSAHAARCAAGSKVSTYIGRAPAPVAVNKN